MPLLHGIARKVSVPVVALSLLGWILYIIGFAVVNNGTNYKTSLQYTPDPGNNCSDLSYLALPPQRASLYWFPHWIVVIAGPFLYISTLLHLVFAKWFTGVPTQLLTSLYLVCGGAVVYTWAVELFDSRALIAVAHSCPPDGWLTNSSWGLWPLIEWIGALSSIIFLTCYMLLWAWFSDPEPKYVEYDQEEGEEYEAEEYEEEQAAETAEDKEEEEQETTVE